MNKTTLIECLDRIARIESPDRYYLSVYRLSEIPLDVAKRVKQTGSLAPAYEFVNGQEEDVELLPVPPCEKKLKVLYAGSVKVVDGGSGIRLYPHQEEAFVRMNERISKSSKSMFKGLLVLPTGGGKTMTAARWIAENVLDKGVKVLWLAHRHELLEQAKATFVQKLAFSDVFANKKSLNYRIVSGAHDQAVRISRNDDIIFASKDSLRSELSFGYLKDNWLYGQNEVFVVIDEAHHAVAKTYRDLIDKLAASVTKITVLGLTATAIRTKEKENSLLARVFPDGMIYSVDLKTLIRLGILSEPIFEEVDTEVDLTNALTDEQIANLNKGFDVDSIGEEVAAKIAENSVRNACIVNRYCENKEKYGKTIVFAVNIQNALALNALFKSKGVRSDFVVSDITDTLGNSVSSKENKAKIARFRKGGDLDVLVNVNILTEGTDVPDVQSVFLTRPTTSTILMTQMMGRGLRGEKAGGTKEAYIVTFMDHWDEHIAWVNPEKLYIDDNVDFNDLDPVTRKSITRLIAISKIEEYAILSDARIDPQLRSIIESVDFMKRVPTGIMKFQYPMEDNGVPSVKNCEVLVYDNLEMAYKNLLAQIPTLFAEERKLYEDELPNDVLYGISDYCEMTFFAGVELYPAYRIQDIDDIVTYYFKTGSVPTYFTFSDRSEYDIKAVAQTIIDRDLGPKRETEYVEELWQSKGAGWQTFFDFKIKNFRREVNLAKERILHPEDYELNVPTPVEIYENRKYEDCDLGHIRQADPAYGNWLRKQVFEKYKDANGNYYSALSGFASSDASRFEVDHIVPISRGGKTVIENLQLLTRSENKRKGNR